MPHWVSKTWETLKNTFGAVAAWSGLIFAVSWTTYQVVQMHEAQLIPIQSGNAFVVYGTMTLIMVPGMIMMVSLFGIGIGVLRRLGEIFLPEKLRYLLD